MTGYKAEIISKILISVYDRLESKLMVENIHYSQMTGHKAEIISKIWISVYDQPESCNMVKNNNFSQKLVTKQKFYRKCGFQSMTNRKVVLW